jgi:hypothetical protein
MSDYYAIISQHAGGIALYFADLLTCNVFALTMHDTVIAAGGVSGHHLAEQLRRSGADPPPASSLKEIREHPDNADDLAVLVSPDNGALV